MSRRVAIYARVSTVGSQSVDMQLRDLRELAKCRSFEVVTEYCDHGVSGSRETRPALDALLKDARRRKFDAVLVWKLDRLGRSLVHLVRLLQDLRSLSVELISFSEGLDFTTTTGKLLYQVISAFAEFERDCIRERVRAGLRNARAVGKKLGRPRMVGTKSGDGTLRNGQAACVRDSGRNGPDRRFVEMLLEASEYLPDLLRRTQIGHPIGD
jgi:DNA invertase Pin-like site-specific DNA recombinase